MRSTNRYLRTLCLLFLFCFTSLGAFAQTVSVTGTVKDAAGEPLHGAWVGELGTTRATVTDADGAFTVQVSSDGQLTVSYVGYLTQTVDVAGRAVIDVVMQDDSQRLDDVVVIGYGTQRREAVTGSVASMRGEVLREVPGGTITQALQGRIAGVQMTQTNSRPGSAMEIRIRGVRSLTASNDPLIVLDGIPMAEGFSLANIDNNAIKSIDILKDASATAIYGSRGANGVVLVTTKTGIRGVGTAKVSYNGYYGIKDAIRVPMMNGEKLYKLKQYLTNGPGGGTGPYAGLGSDEAADVNTDWQKLLLRQGFVTSHDVGVAGGSNVAAYSLGAGYYHDQSPIPTQNFTRYSLRANIDMQAGKWFRFGLMTNSNYNYTQGQQFGLDGALSRSPLANPYDAEGNLKRTVYQVQDEAWVYTKKTIEDNQEIWRNDTRALGTYNTLYAEVSAPWVQGLKYRVNVGLNYTQTHNGQSRGRGINSTNPDLDSEASIDNRNYTNWTVENILSYDRTFNEKHNVNVVALYSAEQTTYNRSNMSGTNFPDDRFQYWNIGRAEGPESGGSAHTVNPANSGYWQRALQSVMARVMYDYDDRYMISAAVRHDGSSVLAKGHQWHTYPAVSAGWNIANEAFMENASAVNQLKLRVGFGQTSNQAVDPYSTLGVLNTRDYNFGDEFVTGYYVSELANSTLGWEFSTTWNFGLDFGFFNNRLSGSIEYYIQKTKNVLQDKMLPPTSGVSSFVANVGKTQNKGFELTLNGSIFNNYNGWSWDVGFNLYLNRNKLIELADGVLENTTNNWFVGHPINVIYDYKPLGLWQEGDEFIEDYEPGAGPGDIRVKYNGEYDEDGRPSDNISATDREVLSLEANFMGGFNTRVAWKNLDLSIVGTFQSGGILVSTLYQGNGYLNQLNGRRGQVDVNYWTPENTKAKWPNPWGLRDGDNNKYMNTMGYFDGSYMKISTITLGYNLPKKWMDRAGIDNIRVYFTAQNPFVLFSPYTKLSGLDPEPNTNLGENSFIASNSNDNLSRIMVVGTNTPNTRNYLFGLSITF